MALSAAVHGVFCAPGSFAAARGYIQFYETAVASLRVLPSPLGLASHSNTGAAM